MAYITEDDYSIVTDETEIQQIFDNETRRLNAEKTAIEMVKGYLKSRYDTDAIFSAVGENRHPVILLWVIDIVVYTILSTGTGRFLNEIRQIRYDQLIKDLEKLSKGLIVYDLPTVSGSSGEDVNKPFRWGSEKRTTRNTNW
jgi:hypothetical protein